MNITKECVECIINQSARVASHITKDEKLTSELISNTKKLSKDFDFQSSPPVVAKRVYEELALIAKKTDLYDEVKKQSTLKALELLPKLVDIINSTDQRVKASLRVAVAGNVIDLASEVEFDVEEEVSKIASVSFAKDDFDTLIEKIEKASTLLYIGDNVGEHIFDFLAIKTLKQTYPKLKIYFMVRGTYIINDVTLENTKDLEFEKYCEIIDSKVPTPGFVYSLASKESKEIFDTSDVVITKGMGNYECLTPTHRKNLAYLLKVKCNVVAAHINLKLGDLVCKFI